MSAFRISIKPALLMIVTLAIHTGATYGQQRPGIRLNVNPPEDCYVTDPVEPENIYFFLRVQILALSLAQRGAWANAEMLETEGGAPLDEIAKTMAGLRKERIDNTCASFVISYYNDSKIPAMATSAKVLAYAYDELGDMDNQMLSISLQKSLRRSMGASPLLQLSRLLDKRREILGNMKEALNLSLLLLIDEGRTNAEGKPDHLILKKAEIGGLLDYLHARFPTLKNSREVGGLSGDFVEQAASIQMFFDSGYRPADLP
jgi:hypothetical protein